MKKGQISNLLRQLRLIYWADWTHFYFGKFRNRKINKEFKKNHPDIPIPPDYLIYESFQMDYSKYFNSGHDTAELLAGYFKKHIDLKNKKILDWGCGPGRVIRHLPSVIGNDCEYYGTDYNKKSIEWCTNHLPGIHFNHNSLEAKLPYSNNSMDVIYCLSIFTHLSEQMHYDWYKELFRVLKPNGIMYLTTQGNNFKIKLTDSELNQHLNGELIIRGKVKEGHRTFSAFHPEAFMRKLFHEANILDHIEPKSDSKEWIPQDIWIIRK